MKQELYTIICAALLSMNCHAQIGKSAGFFSSLGLNSDKVTITESNSSYEEDSGMTTFNVECHETGDYHISLWMLPTTLKNGNSTIYHVSVNGNIVEEISSDKANWQSLQLKNTVTLNEGSNEVCIFTDSPEIPRVEFVRFAKDAAGAEISSTIYDNYLSRAEAGQLADYKPDYTKRDKLTNSVGNPAPFIKANQYFKYSFLTLYHFEAGQKVTVSSKSAADHFIELFSTEYGKSSWKVASQQNDDSFTAEMNVEITETGYYFLKSKTATRGKGSVITLDVNGICYEKIPIYNLTLEFEQPADGNVYATLADSECDPLVTVQGGENGKTIMINDDGTTRYKELQLRINTSYFEQQYDMPTSSMDITSYSSYVPEGNATFISRLLLEGDLSEARKLINGIINDYSGIENITTVSEDNSSVIYDIAGRKTGNPTQGLYIINGNKVVIKDK